MSNMLYKSQLQEYAQKECVAAPVYDTTKDGPPHMPNFKSTVIVNGIKYNSPEGFQNRKTAEQAAAQVALKELRRVINEETKEGTNGAIIVTNPVYETGLCKNLLQEHAQKLSLPVPLYKSTKTGEGPAATFTAVVEIAGISYQGGPGHSKKAAEIKAARTALSAIHAQEAFQAFPVNPTISHSDVVAGTRSSRPEVHAGMKRERADDQSSAKRKTRRNKRHKALKKKKEIIHGSTDKGEMLGETSSKATENGQQAAATSNVIADGHKNPQEETSMDEGGYTKQEKGPCCEETEGTTENPGQLSVEVAAATAGGYTKQEKGPCCEETERTTENPGQLSVEVAAATVGGYTKQEKGPCSQETEGTTENPGQLSVEVAAATAGGYMKQEKGPCSQETEETTENPGQLSVEVAAATAVTEPQNKDGYIASNPEGPCSQETEGTTENPGQLSVEVAAATAATEPQNKDGYIASNPVGNDEKGKQEMNEDTDKYSVDKNVQKEYETTNHQVVDPLKKYEHESNQKLEEPAEKEDLKGHKTPENANQIEVAPPLET